MSLMTMGIPQARIRIRLQAALFITSACFAMAVLTSACGGEGMQAITTDTGGGSTADVTTASTVPNTTPTVPVRVVTAESLRGAMDVARKQYSVGRVRWVYPRKLRLHEERDIQVAVSVKKSVAELEARFAATGKKGGGRLRIYSVMRADLAGVDFKITALPPSEQAVDPYEATFWTWTVEPTATGRHVLHLSLSGVLRVHDPGDPLAVDRFVNVGTYRQAFVIESVSESPGQRMADVAGRNVAWLVPAAITLALAYFEIRRRKNSGTVTRSAEDAESKRGSRPSRRRTRPPPKE